MGGSNDIVWQDTTQAAPAAQSPTSQPATQPSGDIQWDTKAAPAPAQQQAQAGADPALKDPEYGSTEWYASKLPEGSDVALATAKKYLIDPFEKMAAKGAEGGREIGEGLVTGYDETFGSNPLKATVGETKKDTKWYQRNNQKINFNQTPEESVRHAEEAHPIAIGAARGIGSTAGSLAADPRNWALMGAGDAVPILNKLMGAGFAGMMTKDALDNAKYLGEHWDELSPAERAESITKSGLGAVMAAFATGHAAGDAGRTGIEAAREIKAKTAESFKRALTPDGYQNKQIGDATVPTRPTGPLARAAEARQPGMAKDFLIEKTAPAVAEGVSKTIQSAAGIEGDHEMTTEDPFGLDSMSKVKEQEYQAPVQRIDSISNNAFSEAQMARQAVSGDFSKAGKEEWKKQTQTLNQLWEDHRSQLESEGVDVDGAKKAWGQKAALDTIEKAMRKTTEVSADPSRPYDLKPGKTLGTTIKNLLQHDDAPFQKLFGSKYAEAKPVLEDLSRTLNEQSKIAGDGPTPIDALMKKLGTRIVTDAIGGGIGAHFGGGYGAAVGAGAVDFMTNKASDMVSKWYLGKVLTTPKAAELLNNALKVGGDPTLVGNQLKTLIHNADPTNGQVLAKKLADLWHDTRGEAGLPGTIEPFRREETEQLKKLGMSDEDISQLQNGPEEKEKTGNNFVQVPHEEYAVEAKSNPQAATLTDPEAMQDNKHYSNGEGVYYSISPEGDLQGVVNNSEKKGALAAVMPDAIKNGAKTLDAWDIYLPKQYEKYGFERTRKVPYDEKTYGPPSKELKDAWKAQGWKEGDPNPAVQYMKLKEGISFKNYPGSRIGGNGREYAEHNVEISKNGTKIGDLKFERSLSDPESASVISSEISPEHTRTGLGKQLYREAARVANSQGLKYLESSSDENLSLAARKMWSSMTRELPGVVEGGQDGPAFRVPVSELLDKTSGTPATMMNASGESSASIEAQNRLKSQQGQGLRVYDVDSRKSSSKDAWHPVMASVDRVDQTAQPFHHLVQLDPKTGEVSILDSGRGAKPLPTNERIQAMLGQAVGESAPARPAVSPEQAYRKSLAAKEIATRQPYSATASGTNDPAQLSGLDALNQADKMSPARSTQAGKPVLGVKQKLVASLADYKDNGISHLLDASNPDKAIEKYVNHVKENLKWLYNATPESIRNVAKQWYETAHNVTKGIADKNGISHEQAAAVTAALSPKNDWNNNIGQAQRLIEHYANDRGHVWTKDMSAALTGIQGSEAISEPLRKALETIRGKKYDQLTAKTPEALLAKKAMWFRVLDEAHGGKDTPIYGPDGSVNGSQTLNWGQVDPIAKALKILEDGSIQNIHDVMGEGHKIRNFYNNIINPWSDRGHVTIDTHAVGAAHTKPYSQEDQEVAHNFGSGNKAGTPSPAKHAATGVKGSYAVHEEAYRRAAKDLGLQPRELQSITWEGIRSLMGDDKKTPELRRQVTNIWRAHEAGQLTFDQAREEIMKASGGFSKPSWMSDEDWERNPNEEGDTSFDGGQ